MKFSDIFFFFQQLIYISEKIEVKLFSTPVVIGALRVK